MKKIVFILFFLVPVAAVADCTPDMPAARKPWIASGQTPCDWAGYTCTDSKDCIKCNVAVANCEI